MDAYNSARKSLVTPHQNLLNLLALLGKLPGGIRTICKTPMCYRMICRIDTGVEQLDVNKSAAYDTCGKGKSALFAAVTRNLIAEVAYPLGNHSVTVFSDFQKLCVNIHSVTLMQEAIHRNVSLCEFLIGPQQHRSPRVLQCSGVAGVPAIVYKNTFPGCKKAVTFIKIFQKRHNSNTRGTQTHDCMLKYTCG